MSYSWGAARNMDVDRQEGSPSHSRVTTGNRAASGSGGTVLGHAVGSLHMRRLAAELAPMVGVWERLIAQHTPNPSGRCRVCTKGGTGLPSAPWPCSVYGIAEMARRRHLSDTALDGAAHEEPQKADPGGERSAFLPNDAAVPI